MVISFNVNPRVAYGWEGEESGREEEEEEGPLSAGTAEEIGDEVGNGGTVDDSVYDVTMEDTMTGDNGIVSFAAYTRGLPV